MSYTDDSMNLNRCEADAEGRHVCDAPAVSVISTGLGTIKMVCREHLEQVKALKPEVKEMKLRED
jgi:hypothetical protein